MHALSTTLGCFKRFALEMANPGQKSAAMWKPRALEMLKPQLSIHSPLVLFRSGCNTHVFR